jgi:uncharacterized protein
MPRSTPEAMLLVDGYNIVGAWAELKLVRDRDGLEAARRCLVEQLTGYSAFQGFDTRLIFDAQYRAAYTPGAGIPEIITVNLSVHYTDFGQTADSFIEKTCADFRQDLRKFKQRLIVATSDRAQQLTVQGYGAELMSAERLAAEVEWVGQRVLRAQTQARKPVGRTLGHLLDPEAKRRMTRMRFGKKDE